jgi:transcriptional regulator with XRE-family HTH domain
LFDVLYSDIRTSLVPLRSTIPQCADIRQYLCKNVGVANIGDAWHRATAERMGRAVAQRRGDAGMTAQQLAERCKDLGAPIHRTTITKIENGRTRFDVGELLILAAALDVPPLVLLYPDLPGGDVEIIPGEPGSSWDAYLWATGMGAPPFADSAKESKGFQLVDAALRRDKLTEERGRLNVDLALRAHEFGPTWQEGIRERLARIDRDIDGLNAVIRESEGVLKDA